jgi:hypothetical protein
MNGDRLPPISFSGRLRDYAQTIEERITKSLLSVTNTNNVTEFLVGVMYGTNFHNRLKDAKVNAQGKEILELADAVERIEWYGNFRGPALACQLQYLYNKGYIAHARFGREDSAVVYLKPSAWTGQTLENPARVEIVRSLRRLDPDVMDESDTDGIRAWWD